MRMDSSRGTTGAVTGGVAVGAGAFARLQQAWQAFCGWGMRGLLASASRSTPPVAPFSAPLNHPVRFPCAARHPPLGGGRLLARVHGNLFAHFSRVCRWHTV